jgi:2-oxoglutarate ferredoxin oxidoreductase subunit gamma
MKKNKTLKCEEILCAGFGGQGIMLAGKLLAQAALLDGKYVTWMPSYGAEVRGGTAHSMTKISASFIGSPVIKNPSICLVMNYPSLVRYENAVRQGGLLIVNKTLVDKTPKRKDISVINIPMTKMASLLGNIKAANMVGLGTLVKRTRVVSKESFLEALAEFMKGKEDLFKLNKKAFEKGYTRQ